MDWQGVYLALVIIGRATRIRDEGTNGGLLFEGSGGCRRDNTCDIYYCDSWPTWFAEVVAKDNVTIPSVPEIVALNEKLTEIHEKTLGSHQERS